MTCIIWLCIGASPSHAMNARNACPGPRLTELFIEAKGVDLRAKYNAAKKEIEHLHALRLNRLDQYTIQKRTSIREYYEETISAARDADDKLAAKNLEEERKIRRRDLLEQYSEDRHNLIAMKDAQSKAAYRAFKRQAQLLRMAAIGRYVPHQISCYMQLTGAAAAGLNGLLGPGFAFAGVIMDPTTPPLVTVFDLSLPQYLIDNEVAIDWLEKNLAAGLRAGYSYEDMEKWAFEKDRPDSKFFHGPWEPSISP
jgi:hypothetical protein